MEKVDELEMEEVIEVDAVSWVVMEVAYMVKVIVEDYVVVDIGAVMVGMKEDKKVVKETKVVKVEQTVKVEKVVDEEKVMVEEDVVV